MAQSRQKSYVDPWHREMTFSVSDMVFLKVSLLKGVMRFGKKGKLSPRFIGPFEILGKFGSVAYQVALPLELSGIHLVFHVPLLKKYVADPSYVIKPQEVQMSDDLSYEEEPVAILDHQVRKLCSKEIPTVKVLWRNHSHKEAAWEAEASMREKYPHLFESM